MMDKIQHKLVLHGGARQLEMRWRNADDPPPHSISRYEVAPGDVCTKHVHTGKTETWVIVTGIGEMVLGDHRFVVGPGDAIVTPPGTPHALNNTGSHPLHFLNLVTITEVAPVTTTELAE
jgi:mannose-6-phosphate isomerase-like protein (cupin superfamily)